jgi:hypothetical protein
MEVLPKLKREQPGVLASSVLADCKTYMYMYACLCGVVAFLILDNFSPHGASAPENR